MKKAMISILVFFLIVGSLTFAYRLGYKKESQKQEQPTQCLTVVTENGAVAIPQDEVVSYQIGKQLPSEAQQNLKEEPISVIPEGDYIFKQPYDVVQKLLSGECVRTSGKKVLIETVLVKKWTTKNGLIYGTITKTVDDGIVISEVHKKITPLEAENYLHPWKGSL